MDKLDIISSSENYTKPLILKYKNQLADGNKKFEKREKIK